MLIDTVDAALQDAEIVFYCVGRYVAAHTFVNRVIDSLMAFKHFADPEIQTGAVRHEAGILVDIAGQDGL